MKPKGFANLIIIIAALVALSAIASTYLVLEKQKVKVIPEGRFCTMEAKQCPDGSYVGRTGPNCGFASCPRSSSTSVSDSCTADSDCVVFLCAGPMSKQRAEKLLTQGVVDLPCASYWKFVAKCVSNSCTAVSSVPQSFAEVSRSCSLDSDCVMVNQELNYGGCLANVCETVDYALPKFVAVNSQSFEWYREAQVAKHSGQACPAYPPPQCPTKFIDRGLMARCIVRACQKGPWVNRELPFHYEAGGAYGGEKSRVNLVAKTEAECSALWRRLPAMPYPPPTVDILPVDCSAQMLIGAALGEQATGGYSIEITKVVETQSTLEVYIKKTSPGYLCPVTEAITHPFHIVSLGRVDKPAVFKTEMHVGQPCH